MKNVQKDINRLIDSIGKRIVSYKYTSKHDSKHTVAMSIDDNAADENQTSQYAVT